MKFFMTMGNFQMIVLQPIWQQNGLTKDVLFAIERLRLSLRQLITGIVGTAIYPNSEVSKLIDLQLEAREGLGTSISLAGLC